MQGTRGEFREFQASVPGLSKPPRRRASEGHPLNLHRKGARMATRAVARRKSATGGTTDAARSVRAVGGEIADRDLVGMYLDEIARTPLLDAAKEVELSQAVEAGVFARQVLDGVVESKAGGATREELEALVAEGERAKDIFIRSNLRLVVAVARRYPRAGLPL